MPKRSVWHPSGAVKELIVEKFPAVFLRNLRGDIRPALGK
jgi:hypothetical protein